MATPLALSSSPRPNGGKPPSRIGKGASGLGLFLTLALVAGCGPVYSRPAGWLPPPHPNVAPAAPGPAAGGTLAFWTVPWPHLDPHQTASPGMHGGVGLVYGYLLRYDTAPDAPNLRIVPAAVAAWHQPNERTYLLRLRPGVRWQDLPPLHGRDLTAEDVVYSLDRARTPGWPGALLLRDMERAEAVDQLTVRITLRRPSAPFLTFLAHGQVKLVAQEAVAAGGGDLKQGPSVGTGPFILEHAAPGVGVRLRRNPDYWEQDAQGWPLPYLERMEVLVLPDPAARYAAFRTGRLDVAPCAPQECALFREAVPTPVLVDQPAWSVPQIGLKVSHKALQDVRVRKAISKALDRRGFHETIYGRPYGQGWYHFGFVAPDRSWLLPQAEFEAAWDDQVPEAQRLLKEAGYPNGLDLTLTCANYGSDALSACEFLSRRLGRAGIHAPLQAVDPAAYLTTVAGGPGRFELFYGPSVPLMEPDLWLLSYHSQGERNVSGINDPELDRLIAAQRQERTPEHRRQLLLDIQRRLLEQSYSLHPRAVVQTTALQPWVRNSSPLPDSPTPRWLHYAWVTGDRPLRQEP